MRRDSTAIPPRVACIFPGQGAQVAGMGRAAFARFPHAVEEACEVLGWRIDRLCLDDPEGRLGQTRYTQPALFLTCALEYRAWREDGGVAPAAAAGHSLGEYVALHAAGGFDLVTGLRLVAERGRLMGLAQGGGMAAVIGLAPRRLAEIVAAHPALDVANVNSYEQTVVAGPVAALEAAEAPLRAAGARAVIRLDVSAAFHSRAMRDAAAAFGRTLAEVAFAPLAFPVIGNRRAFAYRDDEIAGELQAQITAPVRWIECIEYLLRMGLRDFQEIGPGRSMTRLIDQIRAASVFAS
ncbi:ACP S-malonyltransferase [Methylobacterium aquaticum]|uniref:ACP S-malonyltransferase n=1 Tax=Methylobacterium aquaticum TaxID=270351 RepID=UPI003D163051